MLVRKPKRNRLPVKPVPKYPGITMISVPVGLLKTIVQRCEETVHYGDVHACKAKWERADAADFYRRAAEIVMMELNNIINQKED